MDGVRFNLNLSISVFIIGSIIIQISTAKKKGAINKTQNLKQKYMIILDILLFSIAFNLSIKPP